MNKYLQIIEKGIKHSIFIPKDKKILFCIFFVLQYLLFRQFIVRELLGIYPTAHDQVIYLTQAFELYKSFQTIHITEIARIFSASQNGIFLQSLAAIGYIFFGPSRELALTINFLFFLCLQLFIYRFYRKLGGYTYGYLFYIGLAVMMPFIYISTGGMVDFRLDFAAYCLNFMFLLELTIFLKKSGKKSALILTSLIAIILLTRVNLIPVYVVFFLVMSGFFLFIKRRDLIKKLLLIYLASFILVTPFIAINLNNLRKYYVVGHLTGKEKIYRKAETQTWTQKDALLFYPKNLYERQIGRNKSFLLLTLMFVFGIVFFQHRKKTFPADNWHIPLLAVAGYGLSFAFLYMLDEQKSAVVGINLTIPLIICIYLLYRISSRYMNDRLLFLLTTMVFFYGLLASYKEYNKDLSFRENRKMMEIATMMRYVNDKVDEYNIRKPVISAFYNNEVSGFLAMYYHEYDKNKLIYYNQYLGNNLGWNLDQKSLDDARRALDISNIVFLTVGDWPVNWIPFNKNANALRDNSVDVVEKNFCRDGPEFNLPEGKMLVYFRPSVAISRTTDNWLEATTNIEFTASRDCQKKFNTVMLRGKTGRYDKDKFTLQLRYFIANKEIGNNQIEIGSNNSIYEITIPLQFDNAYADKISVQSNDYMSPCKISSSPDCRELLFRSPDEVRIQ